MPFLNVSKRFDSLQEAVDMADEMDLEIQSINEFVNIPIINEYVSIDSDSSESISSDDHFKESTKCLIM